MQARCQAVLAKCCSMAAGSPTTELSTFLGGVSHAEVWMAEENGKFNLQALGIEGGLDAVACPHVRMQCCRCSPAVPPNTASFKQRLRMQC